MKLSVIIPVYNVAESLDRCVGSVVGQLVEGSEVILVDDGSTDGSADMCDAWTSRDARLRVIHQKNGGLSNARNTGLQHATGKYVMFVDSDDYLMPDTVPALIDEIESRPDCEVLEFPVLAHHGSEDEYRIDFQPRTYRNAMTTYWLRRDAYQHAYAWNKVWRRELFEGIHFPEGRKFEDVLTTARIMKKARVVATTDKGRYVYCWNEQGITAQASAADLADLLDAHVEVMDTLLPAESLRTADFARYYMQVVNIQIDIYHDEAPTVRLKPKRLAWSLLWHKGVNLQTKLKFIVYQLFGIKNLCRITNL